MTKPLLSNTCEIFGSQNPEEADDTNPLFGSYPHREWSCALHYFEHFGLPDISTILLTQDIGKKWRHEKRSYTSGNTRFILPDDGEDRLSNEKYYYETQQDQHPPPPDLTEDRQNALKFIGNIPELITDLGDIFEAYQGETACSGINRFLTVAEVFRDITQSIVVEKQSDVPPRQWKVEIPEQYIEFWNGPEDQILRGFYGDQPELPTQMLRMAWSKFEVEGMSLYEFSQHFSVVMDFVSAAQYLHSNPNEDIQPQRHSCPEIIESKTGFQLQIRDYCYPPGLPVDASKPEITDHDALRHFVDTRHEALVEAGIIENRQFEFHYPRESEHTWKPGITESQIRKTLANYQHRNDEEYRTENKDLHQEAIEILVQSSKAYEFIPFEEEITLDDTNWLYIVSGRNRGSKTWRTDAIAYNTQEAQMGKYTAARRHRQSRADKIYHSGDIPEANDAYSSFEARMQWIAEVFEKATIDSLVLIDEICRETSHEYGLAIAWAITEKLYSKKIRTIITTHIPELNLFEDPKGEAKLTGIANRVQLNTKPNRPRKPGVKAVSVGKNFQLNDYPVSDSEAFDIAEQYLPGDIIARAKEIYALIHQERPIKYVLKDIGSSVWRLLKKSQD